MKFIGAVIVICLALLGAFLFVNWESMISLSKLSFLFYETQASLGLILLGITLTFGVLFISYILTLRTSMLMDVRRHTNELQAQRKLADSAETSRLDQLREQVTNEFVRLHTANEEANSKLMARTEDMEQSLRQSIHESTNSLSASMGEMEEKLDRTLAHISE